MTRNFVHELGRLPATDRVSALVSRWPAIPGEQRAECLEMVWYDHGDSIGRASRPVRDRLWPVFLRMFRDVAAFAPTDLPAEVTIYRGISATTRAAARRWCRGLSWTRQESVAAWFALRFRPPEQAFVARAVVPREHVVAVLPGSEQEVIVAVPEGIVIDVVEADPAKQQEYILERQRLELEEKR